MFATFSAFSALPLRLLRFETSSWSDAFTAQTRRNAEETQRGTIEKFKALWEVEDYSLMASSQHHDLEYARKKIQLVLSHSFSSNKVISPDTTNLDLTTLVVAQRYSHKPTSPEPRFKELVRRIGLPG